jgi:hypothetical protein
MAMLGPGDAGPSLLADMQKALSALVPGQVEHVPTGGHGRPFERFAERGRP